MYNFCSLVTVIQNFMVFNNFIQFNDVFNANNRVLDLFMSNLQCKIQKRCDFPLISGDDAHYPALKVCVLAPKVQTDLILNHIFQTTTKNLGICVKLERKDAFPGVKEQNGVMLSKQEDIVDAFE